MSAAKTVDFSLEPIDQLHQRPLLHVMDNGTINQLMHLGNDNVYKAMYAKADGTPMADLIQQVAPRFINYSIDVTFAARVAQAARDGGLTYKNTPARVAYLLDGEFPENPEEAYYGINNQKPKLRPIRHLINSHKWNSWPKALLSALSPDAISITWNSLLIDYCKTVSSRVHYHHQSVYLEKTAGLPRAADMDQRVEGALELLEETLLPSDAFDSDIALRMRQLFAMEAVKMLEAGIELLDGVAQLKALPKNFFASTGTPQVTRALSHEVRKRGGSVTRFDHGGTASMVDHPTLIYMEELYKTDNYVIPGQGIEQYFRASATAPMRDGEAINFIGHTGDPLFKRYAQAGRTSAKAKRLLYAPSFLRGFSCTPVGNVPDPVLLDWQTRLCQALVKIPGTEVIAKPHPEGLVGGMNHPVAKMATTARFDPFEDVVPDVDIFIWDYFNSTAFWGSLCSDRPVILLKSKVNDLHPAALELVKRRCTIIDVDQDEAMRMILDEAALKEAIAAAPERIDNSEILALFCGQA